jgi:hypothetical protein
MGCLHSSVAREPAAPTAPTEMLCQLCSNLTLQSLNRGAHHASCCSEIEVSADKGCELCSQIVTAIQRATPVPPSENSFARALQEVGCEEGIWLFWDRKVNTGIIVASRCACTGVTEDCYGTLHLYVEPSMSLKLRVSEFLNLY